MFAAGRQGDSLCSGRPRSTLVLVSNEFATKVSLEAGNRPVVAVQEKRLKRTVKARGDTVVTWGSVYWTEECVCYKARMDTQTVQIDTSYLCET